MNRLLLILLLSLMLPAAAAATDWNKPVSTDNYLNVLTYLAEHRDELATLFRDSTPSNLADGAVRLNRSTGRFETFTAATTSWGPLTVAVTSADSANSASDSSKLKGVDHRGVGGTAEHPAATTSTAGFMAAGDKAKLNGIETGATADMTAGEILAAVKTVDGSGSGLDADTVDGQEITTWMPTGIIAPYGGSTAPTGWLLCQGQAVSRTTYSGLFAVIGTTYGIGNGSTTFNLPDLRGRTAIGAGQGSGLSNRALAGKGGEESHQLTVSEMPSHNHGGATGAGGAHDHGGANGVITESSGIAGEAISGIGYAPLSAAPNHAHTISSQGSGAAHNNMQPYLTTNFIIKH